MEDNKLEVQEEVGEEIQEEVAQQEETVDMDSPDFDIDKEIEDFKVYQFQGKTKETEQEIPSEAKPDLVEINDEYIANQPEDVRNIYEGIKGEKLTPKVLKNYVNSQRWISEQKQSSVQQEVRQIPKVESEYGDKVKELTILQLKNKYNDIPAEAIADAEVFKDYLRDIQIDDPLKAIDVLQDYKSLHSKVNNDFQTVVNYQQNWETVNYNNLNSDVGEFKSFLSKYNLKPEDIGLNLELDESRNNEYILNNILRDNGDIDARVVKQFAGLPLVEKGAVYNKLVQKNIDKIVEMAQVRARRESVANKKTIQPPPSLSASNVQGTRKETHGDMDNIDDLSLEEIEKKLEKLKTGV